MNIGTTTEQAARAVLGHRHLQAITSNISVARILSENADFTIVMAGGGRHDGDFQLARDKQAVAFLKKAPQKTFDFWGFCGPGGRRLVRNGALLCALL